VWQGPAAHSTMIMPYPDPGELFSDMHQQIYGPATSGRGTMQGFVANYLEQAISSPRPCSSSSMTSTAACTTT
jgi:phospholipase C